MPGPCHRHHLRHLPAPRVPLPYASHPGGRCSREHPGHAVSTQRDVLRGPGAWLPSGPLPTTPLHCPQSRRVCPRIWGKGQQLGSHLSGMVTDSCATHIAEYPSWLRIQSNPPYLHLARFSSLSAHPGAALLGQTKPELRHSPALTPLPGIRKHFLPVLPPGCRQQGCRGGTRGLLPEGQQLTTCSCKCWASCKPCSRVLLASTQHPTSPARLGHSALPSPTVSLLCGYTEIPAPSGLWFPQRKNKRCH